MNMQKDNIKRAVALTYSAQSQSGAKSLAFGTGSDAENIIKAALESGVPVYENPELVRRFAARDILPDVPEELYSAAAAIMEYIYDVSESV